MTKGYVLMGSLLGAGLVTGLLAQQAQDNRDENRGNQPGARSAQQGQTAGQQGQAGRHAAGAQDPRSMSADQRFLTSLYQSNLFEIAFAKLVTGKEGDANARGAGREGQPNNAANQAGTGAQGSERQGTAGQVAGGQGSGAQGAGAQGPGAQGAGGRGAADVNQLARMLIEDHSKANEQVEQVAQRKNITISKELSDWQQAKLQHLSQLPADELTRCFVFDQVGHHHTDVLKLRYQSMHGQDGEVKKLAGQLLPDLQKHLQHASRLAQQTVGGEARELGTAER